MVFEYVYTSVLAPTADVLGLADLIRRSRSYNREHGITGVLVFDGDRFCQYLEGDKEAVLALVAKIQADPRHQEFVTLLEGFAGAERRFDDWSMAYALDTHGTVLESVPGTRSAEAVTLLICRMAELVAQRPSF